MPSNLLRLLTISLLSLSLACAGPPDDESDGGGGDEVDQGGGGGDEDAGGGGDEDAGDVEEDAGGDGTEYIELPEKPWNIEEMGPYRIGYDVDEIVYKHQPTGADRTIRVVYWYPSLQASGGGVARYSDIFFRRGDGVKVRRGLEIDRDNGPYPLLIFSHGNAGLAEQNYFMTEYFASHGWVVASVEHTNNSVRDTDGSINFASAIDRPQDMSALLDWLEELPASHILHKTMTEDVVMSGHSFGGLTTLANTGAEFPVDDLVSECEAGEIDRRICALFSADEQDTLDLFRNGFLDERIKVAIPQTPASGQVFKEGTSAITTPTLMLTGALDRSTPNDEDGDVLWDAMVGEQHRRIDIHRAGHFTFSNMCDILSGIDLISDDGCNEEFIEPALAYEIINLYSMSFARFHLFDEQEHLPLLNGEVSPWAEEMTLMRKDPAPQ